MEIVPLSTGCLGACTYCKTVHARGKLGSYDPEALLRRVAQASTRIAVGSESVVRTSCACSRTASAHGAAECFERTAGS